MRFEDSRRLTGPNLYTVRPGAIAEVRWDQGDDVAAAISAWRSEAGRMLGELGWADIEFHTRVYRGGAALFMTAPLDQLMPATDVVEWAANSAAAVLAGDPPLPLEPALASLREAIAQARWPGLQELAAAAQRHGALFLVDDAGCTVGAGAKMRSFSVLESLPAPTEMPWSELGPMPIGMITGTNGKTTCTRLVTRMARLAGRHPGNTSSDGVLVDERLIESGDCSGPAGAREVLRHPAVDIALLETARGGILRRGLAVERCDAALITNVSTDHLGDYGVDDVATLARVKAVIARGADKVVLNAADPHLVALAPAFTGRLVYFALSATEPALVSHRDQGGEAWFVRDGHLVMATGQDEQTLVAEIDVPLTFGGRARYNTENALASAALARTLGIPLEAIVAGLRTFTSSPKDNPSRGNLLDLHGIKVIIDFGHNPAAVAAVLALANGLAGQGGRVFVTAGMAGDRRDEEIIAVAQAIAAVGPHAVYLREVSDYLRGRPAGMIVPMMGQTLIEGGCDSASIFETESELSSVQAAVSAAEPGDVVLALIHLEPEVETWLEAQGAAAV